MGHLSCVKLDPFVALRLLQEGLALHKNSPPEYHGATHTTSDVDFLITLPRRQGTIQQPSK
jgi:hypothetical protein